MMKKRFLVVAFTLLALAAGSTAWAQQFARPDETLTNTGWSPVNVATPHEAVDETASNNDTDYIDTSTDGITFFAQLVHIVF